MVLARDLVQEGVLKTEELWSAEYDRDTEVAKGFEEGLNRPANYSRGYIAWRK